MTKTWEDYDQELKQDGWNIQAKRHHEEWSVLFYHSTEITRLTKGSSLNEATEKGYQLIKTGKLWEDK